jgi:hypothetical protein
VDVKRLLSPAFVVCVATLLVSAGALPAALSALKIRVIKKPIEAELKLNALPAETASWKFVGVDKPYSAEIEETLGTKNYINRLYVEKNPADPSRPRAVELHLAYYTGQVDTVPHVPERCMVGGGMAIASAPVFVELELDRSGWVEDTAATELVRSGMDASATIYTARLGPMSRAPGVRVRLPRRPEDISLLTTKFREPRSGQEMHAGYFFIANGGIARTAEAVRGLAFDRRSEYAYYLKVQVTSMQARTPEELGAKAQELLSELLPDIMLCVPDWVEVQRGTYPGGDGAGAGSGGS